MNIGQNKMTVFIKYISISYCTFSLITLATSINLEIGIICLEKNSKISAKIANYSTLFVRKEIAK